MLMTFVLFNGTLSMAVKSTWMHRRGSCCWPRLRTMWSTLVTVLCWRGSRRPWLAPSMRRMCSSTTTPWGHHGQISELSLSLYTLLVFWQQICCPQCIWGSYWKDGCWGYKCCHSMVKQSYCTGDTGISIVSRCSNNVDTLSFKNFLKLIYLLVFLAPSFFREEQLWLCSIWRGTE